MADVTPQSPPLNGDESLQGVVIAFIVWSAVLPIIFVALRIIVRTRIIKIRLWWDDYFIIAAAFCIAVGMALDLVEVHFGFGRHQYYLNSWQLMYFTAYTYVEWIQTFFSLMCTKVSICFLLLRIPVNKRYIIPLQIGVVVLIISNVVLTLLWIFQCWPVQALWDPTVKPRYCFNHGIILNIIFSQAIISVVSDFSFALYPILIIWHVKIRLKDKVGLCLLMGLGVITGSCCIVRTALNGQSVPDDSTYGGITNWSWRTFEIGLGIICACIPTLIPGYKWLKQKLSHHGSSGSGKGAKATGAALPFEPGRHKRREGDSAQLLRATPQDAKSSIVPPSSSGGGSWQEERRPVDNAEAERGIRKTTHMEVKHGEGVDRANDLRPSLNDSRDGF